MKITHPRIFGLLFDNPLMIARRKLDVIVKGVGEQIGVSGYPMTDDDDAEMPATQTSGTAGIQDGIAVIPVYGSLVKRCIGMEAESGLTSYTDLAGAIAGAVADPRVTAILFDIDSWGGECNGAFDLADQIYAARKIKPIYAAANGFALSAAYAIASAAERIYVSQDGAVGSIGVLAMHCDQSKMDETIGLKFTTITYGDMKAAYSPHEPLSDPARAELQGEVDRLGELFVAKVARNRALGAEAIKGTEARIVAGQEAISIGLADFIGTPIDAIGALRDRLRMARTPALLPVRTSSVAASASAVAISLKEDTIVSDTIPADAAKAPPNPTQAPTLPMAEGAAPTYNMSSQEIRQLQVSCKLARKPERLAGFLERNLTFAAAQEELVNAVADAAGDEINTQHFVSQTEPKPKGGGGLMAAIKRRLEQTSRKVRA